MRTLMATLASLSLLGCIDYELTPDPEGELPSDEPDDRAEPRGDEDPLPPGTPTGGLHGRICATADQGLAGVQVMLEHEHGVSRTLTNASGEYHLADVPAGNYTLVIESPDYAAQIPVLVSPNEDVELSHPECDDMCEIPVPCVGLAEALDRQGAQLRFGQSMELHNLSSDLDICIDEWMVAFSDDSQDMVFGTAEPAYVAPRRSQSFPYSVDVFGGLGDAAWWCVERWQSTAPGSDYTYNGSLRPNRLMDLVVDRTDYNRSGIEDHVDVFDGQLQTQHNLWNTIAEHPVLLVGRERSLVRLAGPGSRPTLRVQVRNLGQQPGVGQVVERVPPGFTVSHIDPPAQVQTLDGGATQLTWQVEVDAAEPDFTYQRPTRYHDVELTYRLSLGEPDCQGRCEGEGLTATWRDLDSRPWRSRSEPLIIEHCGTP